jgi:steroid delta-isomerase-like uncharacterized protein
VSTEPNALVSRFFQEMCNRGEYAQADRIFAAGHLYHDPASPWVGPGPGGMIQLISTYRGAFPDAHWTVDETLTAGDTIITRWTGRGIHQGKLMGVAPTGKQVEVPGIWIHRIDAGVIVESWNVWDALGMFQQLGVVELPVRAGAQSVG